MQAACYSGGSEDVTRGLLDIFRIVLATPEHATLFPQDAVLHMSFTKGAQQTNIEIPMIQVDRGTYRIASIHGAHREFASIRETMGGGNVMFGALPVHMRLTKLSGFTFDETTVEGLPRIVGTILEHHVFLGSYRVVSGWQWAGRPAGLWGSQQLGFVQE